MSLDDDPVAEADVEDAGDIGAEAVAWSAAGGPEAHPTSNTAAATHTPDRDRPMAHLLGPQSASHPLIATTRVLDSASGSGPTTLAITTDPSPEIRNEPSPVETS